MKTRLFVICITLFVLALAMSACAEGLPMPPGSDAAPPIPTLVSTEIVAPVEEQSGPVATPVAPIENAVVLSAGERAPASNAPAWVIALQEAHEARVRELAPTYDTSVEAWLRAAGYSWDSLTLAARQPEEETFPALNGEGHDIVVAGYQVEVVGLSFSYPAGMTTDNAVSGARCVQPDAQNPSKVCTDVENFSGTATLWIDLQNWGQFAPGSDFFEGSADEAGSEEVISSGNNCMSITELGELGTINQNLEWPAGNLAGAQITFTDAFVVPEGWTLQFEGSDVAEVSAGSKASLWSPESCRPLSP